MEINTIDVLKALADPIRLSIVKRLNCGDELCACNLLEDFDITQPTLSFHMKKLTASGLVTVRREGIWMKYSVNGAILDQLIEILESIKEQSCQSLGNKKIDLSVEQAQEKIYR